MLRERLRIGVACGTLVFAMTCHAATEPRPASARYVRFIESLAGPSGLVRSRPGEDFSTGWKNALAAMVLLHEGNLRAARGVLDVFKSYQQAQGAAFRGLPQDWSAESGSPAPQGGRPDAAYYWVGDGAGVLRATQYYGALTGDTQRYQSLETALKGWLAARADECATIVAEGSANMYAALSAYRADPAIAPRLAKLRQCFSDAVDFDNVLDHTVRAALVFGDPSGFSHVGALERTETWCVDGTTSVRAYAAGSGQAYVNVGVSAELLLAWKLWRQQSARDLSFLDGQLTRMELGGAPDAAARGLPYLVTQHEFANACRTAILDSTAFMLFALWEWNPFSLDESPAVS